MKKHIPTLFTLANLTCGILATICLLKTHDFELAAYLVLAGALFDFFDGFIARLLGVSGELGKQLDSLADLVTFGLVPGLIGFSLCEEFYSASSGAYERLIYIPLIIALMSAMRLAKFNISTDQSDSFIGVPTPANALFWIGLPFLLEYIEVGDMYTVILLSILSAVLLVFKYKMLSLKFKTFGLKGNHGRWLLVLASAAGFVTLTIITGNPLISLPIIIILYLIISVINNSLSKT
tara:strand:+ start:18079 stop:18786 length:708 start_codon:yes stop_codon:yes gene_type:complete